MAERILNHGPQKPIPYINRKVTNSPPPMHWADSVIESPCMSEYLSVCAIGCSFLSRPQIGPEITWSVPGLWLVWLVIQNFMVTVLLFTSVKRFSVSRVRDFYCIQIGHYKIFAFSLEEKTALGISVYRMKIELIV